MFSDAYDIYMRENPSAHRRKFKAVALQAYALFVAQFGYMPLDELFHVHIIEFRDSQLARGLHANSVRRHINMLNAMVNWRSSTWTLIDSALSGACTSVTRVSCRRPWRPSQRSTCARSKRTAQPPHSVAACGADTAQHGHARFRTGSGAPR